MPDLGAAPQTDRERYDRMATALLNERSTFHAHWADLAEFFFPRRARFIPSDRNTGGDRSQSIIDSTPTYAARTLRSGLHGGMTSPSSPWINLTLADTVAAESGAVKEWLHEVTRRMLAVFLKSNLYNVLPVTYGDVSVFGTAALGIFEDQDVFRGEVFPVGSYAFALDARGLPNTFVREYELTIEQLVERFGYQNLRPDEPRTGHNIEWHRFSDYVKSRYEEGLLQTTVELVWMVTANPPHQQKGFTPWSYISVYFERSRGAQQGGELSAQDKTKLLRKSGYHEFPVLIPRWGVTGGDSWGTDCPGMIALGDAKGLQVLQKKKAQAVEKQINPALAGPTSLKNQKVSLLPGRITYVDDRGASAGGLRSIHEVRLQIGELLEDVREHQFRIDKAFFVDLFLQISRSDQPQKTAREIDERHEEKMLALGPTLERFNDELLDGLIDRVFAMMGRRGLIPEPPPQVVGTDLEVEYVSILGQAQKVRGVALNDRMLASVVAMTETWPQARHMVKPFEVVNSYASMIGVDPSLIRTSEEAQELLEAEQRAIAEQQAAEQAKLQAGAVRDLAAAPTDGDTALTRLGESVGATA